MRILKFASTLAVSTFLSVALSAFSQTPTVATVILNHSTDTPVSCPYSNMFVDSSTSVTVVTITCTAAVSNSAPQPPSSGPFTLTVNVSNPAGGSIAASPATGFSCGSSQCTSSYAAGTQVAVTATPASGNTVTWGAGPCSGSTSNTCGPFPMNSAVTMTATFSTAAVTVGSCTQKPFPPALAGGMSAWFYGTQGVTYCMPMPPGVRRGQVQLGAIGPDPLIGNYGGTWEVALSKVAGDFDQAKTYTVPGWGGAPVYPYYAAQNSEGGGVNWIDFIGTGSYTGQPYIAQDGTQWWFNIRFTKGTGAIVMTYTPQ